jgi:hypothetical protein
MKVRRIVMGEPTPGTSAFTHVEEVEARSPASEAYDVWGFDHTPELPWHDPAPYVARSHFPGPGGARVIALKMGASAGIDPELRERLTERDRELFAAEPAGMQAVEGPPGTHSSDTIDIGILVRGEVATIATDGTRQILRPGDVYIQNGAPHTWENLAPEPSLIVFVVVPAHRAAD